MARELDAGNADLWLDYAELASSVRVYGHIKHPTMEAFVRREAELRQAIGRKEKGASPAPRQAEPA